MSLEKERPDTPAQDIPAQARRADVLLSWQATCDSRSNKLLVMTLIVTVFYLYYGLISPALSKARLDRINLAKGDLDRILDQFQTLRNRYIYLVNPPANTPVIAGSDMGFFTDKLIPAIRNQNLEPSETLIVANLENDMVTLSKLNNLHATSHPAIAVAPADFAADEFREQLRQFRRALGTVVTAESGLMNAPDRSNVGKPYEQDNIDDVQAVLDIQRLLGGGKAHFDVRNDPVNDLSRLMELESAIRDLKKLANDKNADRTLADKARESLESDASEHDIRMGDTLTKTFPAYDGLQVYTEMSTPLQLSGTTDIGSYARIRDLLNPPFEVSNIADLRRLKQFADLEADRISADQRAPTLNLPFINASIDRDVVLAVTPFFVFLLLHLLAGNVQRSLRLTEALDKDQTISVASGDYSDLGPYHLITFANDHYPATYGVQPDTKVNRFYSRARNRIDFLFSRATPLFVAIVFIVTFVYDLFFSERFSTSTASIVLGILFLASAVLIVAESAFLLSLLSRPSKRAVNVTN